MTTAATTQSKPDPREAIWDYRYSFAGRLSGDMCLRPPGATSRAELISVAHWVDIPADQIDQLAILTDSLQKFDADADDETQLLTVFEGDRAIPAPFACTVPQSIVDAARDVCAGRADSLADVMCEPKRTAANDNVPDELYDFLDLYGGSIGMGRLYNATVDRVKGNIYRHGSAFFFEWGPPSLRQVRKIELPPKPRARFSVDWFDDLEEDEPKEHVLKGVLGVDEFTVISGKPGSGKSVIVTDMACHIAAGKDWHGRRVKQGLVVYIAAERKDLTKRRVRAWRKHHGADGVPLAILGARLDMTSSTDDAMVLAQYIGDLEKDCGHECVWIVVDTLTRVFGPGDQNASKDMSRFVQSCDALREALPGSHVSVIHHTGWTGDRGKGAIDLDGAVDASFLVKKEGGTYLLECDGTNDGEEGVVTRFKMEGVQIGTNEDGEPTIAPVVVPAEAPADGLLRNIRGQTAQALETLTKLCQTVGIEPNGPGYPDSVLVVSEDQWRAAFYEAVTGTQEAKRKAFRRAIEALVRTDHVTNVGQFYFIK